MCPTETVQHIEQIEVPMETGTPEKTLPICDFAEPGIDTAYEEEIDYYRRQNLEER